MHGNVQPVVVVKTWSWSYSTKNNFMNVITITKPFRKPVGRSKWSLPTTSHHLYFQYFPETCVGLALMLYESQLDDTKTLELLAGGLRHDERLRTRTTLTTLQWRPTNERRVPIPLPPSVSSALDWVLATLTLCCSMCHIGFDVTHVLLAALLWDVSWIWLQWWVLCFVSATITWTAVPYMFHMIC